MTDLELEEAILEAFPVLVEEHRALHAYLVAQLRGELPAAPDSRLINAHDAAADVLRSMKERS